MTFNQLQKDLKAGKYHPVYFLYGDENYFIDKLVHYFQNEILPETEKAFNLTVLYGKDADFRMTLDACNRYPVQADKQVVILKEAQEMRTLKDLEDYVKKPQSSTILVISHKHKRPDFRTNIGKALKKHAVVFESKKIYDNQLPQWIHQFVRNAGLGIQEEAVILLSEYLGTDLEKVENELQKLTLIMPPGAEISTKDIEENIGISKDYNIFELQKAIASNDYRRAHTIIDYFRANTKLNPLVVVIFSLYNFFRKIYTVHIYRDLRDDALSKKLGLRSNYFLREYKQAARLYSPQRTERAFSVLQEYDLKSKGFRASPQLSEGELLREMVYKIMH